MCLFFKKIVKKKIRIFFTKNIFQNLKKFWNIYFPKIPKFIIYKKYIFQNFLKLFSKILKYIFQNFYFEKKSFKLFSKIWKYICLEIQNRFFFYKKKFFKFSHQKKNLENSFIFKNLDTSLRKFSFFFEN